MQQVLQEQRDIKGTLPSSSLSHPNVTHCFDAPGVAHAVCIMAAASRSRCSENTRFRPFARAVAQTAYMNIQSGKSASVSSFAVPDADPPDYALQGGSLALRLMHGKRTAEAIAATSTASQIRLAEVFASTIAEHAGIVAASAIFSIGHVSGAPYDRMTSRPCMQAFPRYG